MAKRLECLGVTAAIEQRGSLEPVEARVDRVELERALGELERPRRVPDPGGHLAQPARDVDRPGIENQGPVVLAQGRPGLAFLLEKAAVEIVGEPLGARVMGAGRVGGRPGPCGPRRGPQRQRGQRLSSSNSHGRSVSRGRSGNIARPRAGFASPGRRAIDRGSR